MTRWAEDIDPAEPLPEYPRPQLRRDDWQNLNGLWQFGMGEGDTIATDGQILVPFPIESALSGVGERLLDRTAVYRRTFQVPSDWTEDDGRVLLHFGAVDYASEVFVNGQSVGTHKGGFDPFRYDITDALQPGENTVEVRVTDPTDSGNQPRGKQSLNPGGIWYEPVSGIWQTVWLEPVPAQHVTNLELVPDVDAGVIRVTVDATQDGPVRVEVPGVGEAQGQTGEAIEVAIEDAHLWSPSDPHLYDLEVELLDDEGDAVDEVESYFGMRSVGLARGEDGKVNAITINGEPLFQVGPLDQGWWPDGLYTAPTDEALKYDIEVTKDLGFNMIRKHIKVEPARWYYWADKLGVVVWQDMPSMGFQPEELTAEVKGQFEDEMVRMIETLDNHPSIIMWVVFNEGWGQYDTERVTQIAEDQDATRLISNASGWTDHGVGDVIDMHSYPYANMHPAEEDRVSVLGEFGGLGLVIEDHLWQPDRLFDYIGYEDSESLTAAYEDLFRKVYELRQDGLAAVVYTQTTDVEGEINGLLTYDRDIIKVDAERIRDANLGLIDLYRYEPIVHNARTAGEGNAPTWRYTFEQPSEGWTTLDFDASSWQQGQAGFGDDQKPNRIHGTSWTGEDIWLRREFELTEADLENSNLRLHLHHDDDVKVYIDGVLVFDKGGAISDYTAYPLSEEAKAVLTPGKHVLAVTCHEGGGHQYVDVGLVNAVPYENPMPREDAGQ